MSVKCRLSLTSISMDIIFNVEEYGFGCVEMHHLKKIKIK